MSNIAAFQSKFRASELAAKSPFSSTGASARRRRKFSCLACRTKKLRCDRAQPCGNCRKGKNIAACTYVDYPDRSSTDYGGRLLELQDMIVEVVKEQASTTDVEITGGPSTSSSGWSSIRASTSSQSVSQDGFLLSGPTAWTTILDCVTELVAAAHPEDENSTSSDGDLGSITELDSEELSIFTITRCTFPPDIFSKLPSREVMDGYLSRYFRAKLATFPTVHIPSFQRMYEKFWQDPTAVSLLWSAQLFAILSISASLSEFMGGTSARGSDTSTSKNEFLTATAQCLHLCGYTKPSPYLIEALLIYAQCKYMATIDPAKEVWILFGIIVRLALQMGYHRDPDSLHGISVFHGEMRRRTWAVIRQLDLLNCFQMGLPGALQSYQSDVKAPRNLDDGDFDESTPLLPSSRPEVEPTHILYFIVKTRIMDVFAKILENQSTFHSSNSFQTSTLNSELMQARASVPKCLRIRSMAQSYADLPELIMMRVNIELLLQKSVCILYRQSLLQPELKLEVIPPCIEASMAMLRLQLVLHQEIQPGGQLHQHHWMVSSLSLSDFFLGAIILTLVILKDKGFMNSAEGRERVTLLENSCQLFSTLASQSKQAQKIAACLTVVLSRLYPACSAASAQDMEVYQMPFLPLYSNPATYDNSASTMESLLSADPNYDWGIFDQYLTESTISRV